MRFFCLNVTEAIIFSVPELQDFKERFEKGEESAPVERTAIDVKAEGLGNIKAAFEKVKFFEIFLIASTCVVLIFSTVTICI